MININVIKDLMKENDISTKSAFEKMCGLPNGCVVNWEKGRYKPSLEAAIKIATRFSVSLDFLMDLPQNEQETEGRIGIKINKNEVQNSTFIGTLHGTAKEFLNEAGSEKEQTMKTQVQELIEQMEKLQTETQELRIQKGMDLNTQERETINVFRSLTAEMQHDFMSMVFDFKKKKQNSEISIATI